jgi:hypothetical protein
MGKRVDALVKQLSDLTTDVTKNCTTVRKRFGDYEKLVDLIITNYEMMNKICEKAPKDNKGRPILTGDEGMMERLKQRATWLKSIQGAKDEIVTAFEKLTKDNAKDVADLIKKLQGLLKEKEELQKKTVPVLKEALESADGLKKKIEALENGESKPENLPKMPV